MKRDKQIKSFRFWANSKPGYWSMVFAILLVAGLAGFGVYLFSPDIVYAEQELPVALHSGLKSNYQADEMIFLLPPLKINIIEEALLDQAAQEGNNPEEQLKKVEDQLRSPVPTITPTFNRSTQSVETQQVRPTFTKVANRTATPTQRLTMTVTRMPNTMTPTISATPTRPMATRTSARPESTAIQRPTEILPVWTRTPVPPQPEPTQPPQRPTEPPAPTKPPVPTAPPPPTPLPQPTAGPAYPVPTAGSSYP